VRRVACGVKLGGLLERLIATVPQVRFRLGSVEATEVDDTLARLLIEAPRNLAAHLHAPLQSGSNRVLSAWAGTGTRPSHTGRGSSGWRNGLPVFGLGADVIAGFPGEADEDHRASIALLRALPFTYLHIFPFSVRPDAPAARLPGHCHPRLYASGRASCGCSAKRRRRSIGEHRRGQTADGILTGHRNGQFEVMTEDYLSVYLDTHLWDGRPRFEVTVN